VRELELCWPSAAQGAAEGEAEGGDRACLRDGHGFLLSVWWGERIKSLSRLGSQSEIRRHVGDDEQPHAHRAVNGHSSFETCSIVTLPMAQPDEQRRPHRRRDEADSEVD